MSVKETPTNYRVYYKSMRSAYTQMREDAISAHNELMEVVESLWQSICDNLDTYKEEFDIDLFQYKEFADNEYIDGTFLKTAKGLFINRKNNYTLVSDLFDLFNLARKQKQLSDLNKDIEFYDKLLALSLKEYNEILKIFYTEVHTKMILNGYGYVFESPIGWTCINRCHIDKQASHINYAATKKRKAELEAEGKKIYKKEEAEWCKKNGIEYNAVDARVFMKNEYCYEIPLLDCKLPKGTKYKLDISDYRARSIRGKTNEQLIKDCNFDVEEICKLPVDLRTKLNLCNNVNKMLYLNFIRNENQEPSNIAKIDRKDRQ